MKIYLLCSLNDENYKHPVFEFLKDFEDVHRCIKETIAEDIMNNDISDKEIEYIIPLGNCTMRVEYTFYDDDDNEHFIVFEVFEIEISDGDCLCMFHHAYNGVNFYVEKIGTLEECQNQMLDATAKIANDYDIDITDIDAFDVNEYDSCIDTEDEWKMYNIIQFNKSEINGGK